MSFEQVELERGEFWMIGSSKTCRDLQTAAIWATPSCPPFGEDPGAVRPLPRDCAGGQEEYVTYYLSPNWWRPVRPGSVIGLQYCGASHDAWQYQPASLW